MGKNDQHQTTTQCELCVFDRLITPIPTKKPTTIRLWKKRLQGYLTKIKHCLRRENKANKNMVLMYYEMLRHMHAWIEANKKEKGKVFCMSKNLQTTKCFKNIFPKSGPTHRRLVVNPRHQTPQGQSVTKPGTSLKFPSWEYKFDMKESDGKSSIGKEGLGAEASWEVSNYRTRNTQF